MMVLQAPKIPKPEDILNAVQKAGAQGINGIFLTLSAPVEFIKGLGVPVPELPQPPVPQLPTSGGQSGFLFPFFGGQQDVSYEPYEGYEGGQQDVTIEQEKKKTIWV